MGKLGFGLGASNFVKRGDGVGNLRFWGEGNVNEVL